MSGHWNKHWTYNSHRFGSDSMWVNIYKNCLIFHNSYWKRTIAVLLGNLEANNKANCVLALTSVGSNEKRWQKKYAIDCDMNFGRYLEIKLLAFALFIFYLYSSFRLRSGYIHAVRATVWKLGNGNGRRQNDSVQPPWPGSISFSRSARTKFSHNKNGVFSWRSVRPAQVWVSHSPCLCGYLTLTHKCH